MTYNQGLSNGTNQIRPDGSFMSILLYSIFPAIQICDILYRDGIFKLLRESIPPAYVAWRAGTTTLFLYYVPSPS